MNQRYHEPALVTHRRPAYRGAMFVTMCLTVVALSAPPPPPPVAPAATPDDAALRSLRDYNVERLERGKNAMLALTVWGGANVVAGAIGWPLSEETQWQAFHGMNLGWGTVNLAIAIPALVRNLNADPGSFDLVKTLRAEESLKATLLLNTGLDVAYLTAGAILWERGAAGSDDLMLGFGQSLILQGAFLLVYDVVFYLLSVNAAATLYTRVRDGGAGAEVGLMGRF